MSTDDILDSLTRQAELRQKVGESDSLSLEEIAATEEFSRFQGFNLEPTFLAATQERRSLGHFAFVFMLLMGLTVVWLYSSVSVQFDLALLNGFVRKSGIQSIFDNPTELGIITLTALIAVLWIRRRGRRSGLDLLSN